MLVMEEMGLDYQMISLDFSKQEHKAPSYTKYNPNGRVPAIVDHKNGDLTLWCARRPLLPRPSLLLTTESGSPTRS